MRSLIVLFVTVMLVACGVLPPAPNLEVLKRSNNLSIGMSKSEVLAVMGNPEATRATGNREYLTYFWDGQQCIRDGGLLGCLQFQQFPFLARLVDGKLDAYGDPADFDLSKEDKLNIDLDVDSE